MPIGRPWNSSFGLFQVISDPQDRQKATAIFDTIISFETRLAIIDRLMSSEDVDEVESEMWSRMSARLSKFYKKRHELAHFILTAHGEKAVIAPFCNFDSMRRDSLRRIGVEQIRERSEKFAELFKTMCWFIDRAHDRRSQPRRAYFQPWTSEHPLVPRLRELATQILQERKAPPKPQRG